MAIYLNPDVPVLLPLFTVAPVLVREETPYDLAVSPVSVATTENGGDENGFANVMFTLEAPLAVEPVPH